jgi:hypothetical protein
MLETLYSYYLLRAVSSEIESSDALTNMRTIKFVQLLTNDIILRLCKFRDDNSMSLSFDQVNKVLRKRAAKKERLDSIESKIKEYRRLTHNMENHRNAYIAHLSKRDRNHLKTPLEMFEAIKLALQITDQLCGGENSYRVLNVDLRGMMFGDPGGMTSEAQCVTNVTDKKRDSSMR